MQVLTADSLVKLLQECMTVPNTRGCVMFWSQENCDGFIEEMSAVNTILEFNIKRIIKLDELEYVIEWENASRLFVTLNFHAAEVDGDVVISDKRLSPRQSALLIESRYCLYDPGNSNEPEVPSDECEQTVSIQELFQSQGG